MSEFLNRTKISALERANTELVAENAFLSTKIEKLKAEIDHLNGKDSGEMEAIEPLREKLAEYERRETELTELINTIAEDTSSNEKKQKAVKHLLSALQVEDTAKVESAIDQYYKKKQTTKCTIAFLFGILVALVAWVVTVKVKL